MIFPIFWLIAGLILLEGMRKFYEISEFHPVISLFIIIFWPVFLLFECAVVICYIAERIKELRRNSKKED